MIEPTERLVGVLIERAVEINWRADRHFLWALPFFKRANVAWQMKAIKAPVASKIRGNFAVLEIHGSLFVKLVAQVVENDVGEHGIRAVIGMLQRVREIRHTGNFGIGERCFGGLVVSSLAPFFFQRVFGAKVWAVGLHPERHE